MPAEGVPGGAIGDHLLRRRCRASRGRGARPTRFVVAADSGLAEANRLGVRVDLLVGDMDSVRPGDLEAYERAGGEVQRHPEDKDATDLDLAITAAIVAGAARLTVVGGDGGRLDHLLGNALLLASPRYAAVEIDGVFGGARIHVVRRRRDLTGSPGELVSLFALGGPARRGRHRGPAMAARARHPGTRIDPRHQQPVPRRSRGRHGGRGRRARGAARGGGMTRARRL